MIFPYYGQTATLYSAPLLLAIGAASGECGRAAGLEWAAACGYSAPR